MYHLDKKPLKKDSFENLVKWVEKNNIKDPNKTSEEIAFSIINSKKKSNKKEKKEEKKMNEIMQIMNSAGNWIDKEVNEETFTNTINRILKKGRFKTRDEIINALKSGKNINYGEDWYAMIRFKPKPLSPKQKEYNELSERYWDLDDRIMTSNEPSLQFKLQEKKAEILKKMRVLEKELKIS